MLPRRAAFWSPASSGEASNHRYSLLAPPIRQAAPCGCRRPRNSCRLARDHPRGPVIAVFPAPVVPVVREAGDDQRLGEVVPAGDPHGHSVELGAATPTGGEHLISKDIAHDAGEAIAVILHRHGHRYMGEAMEGVARVSSHLGTDSGELSPPSVNPGR